MFYYLFNLNSFDGIIIGFLLGISLGAFITNCVGIFVFLFFLFLCYLIATIFGFINDNFD